MLKNNKLSLNGIKIPISMGETEEERSEKQVIIIDLKMEFNNQPKACSSDELEDTICYEGVLNKIISFCENKSFKMLEYLACQIYLEIKAFKKNDIKLHVKVQKQYKPLAEVLESVTFEYGDF